MKGRNMEERFPVLPLFHERHARHGHISEEDLADLQEVSGLSVAELHGAVTAYPGFRATSGDGKRVCSGPACAARGGDRVAGALGLKKRTPCLGLCDQPVAVLTKDGPRIVNPSNPSILEDPVDKKPGVHVPQSAFFCDGDPFEVVRVALTRPPEEILGVVTDSGLRGRGGGWFPGCPEMGSPGGSTRSAEDSRGKR